MYKYIRISYLESDFSEGGYGYDHDCDHTAEKHEIEMHTDRDCLIQGIAKFEVEHEHNHNGSCCHNVFTKETFSNIEDNYYLDGNNIPEDIRELIDLVKNDLIEERNEKRRKAEEERKRIQNEKDAAANKIRKTDEYARIKKRMKELEEELK